VVAHELGHAIDRIARVYPEEGIPQKGIETELRNVYHIMNTGQDSPRYPQQMIGPEDFGYRKREDIARELMAEAIRAYKADPNFMKTVAPNAAARIRKYVNNNWRLNKFIQFNTLAPFGAAGALLAGPDGDQD